MKLTDFSALPIRKKSYGGANGNKISVVIDDELDSNSDDHKSFLKIVIQRRFNALFFFYLDSSTM